MQGRALPSLRIFLETSQNSNKLGQSWSIKLNLKGYSLEQEN